MYQRININFPPKNGMYTTRFHAQTAFSPQFTFRLPDEKSDTVRLSDFLPPPDLPIYLLSREKVIMLHNFLCTLPHIHEDITLILYSRASGMTIG